jgi:PAS domain S-box-containing protein
MSRPAVQRLSGDVHDSAKARFAAAFGDVADALLATDSGEVLMCVGPLAQRVGRTGMLLTDLPDGVSSADLNERLERVLATNLATETAHLVIVDGPMLAARLLTIWSDDGARRYLVAVLSEVIAADQLGNLVRNGQVYELLFERVPSGISLVGVDGVFISANPAYCQLVGRSERELQGMTFRDITHPDDLLLDESLAQDVLARRIDRYDIDKRYVRPDGSIAWGHLTVALLKDENEEPLFFIAMLEDITQRKRTQEALQAALELWRTTFDQARVAMVELELDGTITRANAAAGELMGCHPDELLGHRTIDLADQADYEENAANLVRFAKGELKSNTSERRLLDRRGRLRWLSVHTAAVDGADGAVDRLLMQVFDITEERELRERLQRSVEELSLAYREKAALMTALSHDLRTPLAAIRILAELLVANDASTSEAERNDLARRLLAEAARTEGVLGDLVASERASSGLMTPRRVPVALNELVRRVVATESGHQSTHTVVMQLTASDCVVSVDPALVERMVANLISNTLRHTRAGTTIWVSVAEDSVDDELIARLIVADDGGGVPDALKEAIFEPFVRGTDNRPGTGIGLFLIRRFAEFHGGTVTCTDRPGGGASFCVTLPRS